MRFAGEFLTQGGPDFGGMSRNSIELRGKERQAVHAAESQTHQYGMKSVADIRAAEAQAEATIAEGQAAGQAAMFDGLMSGISGIASAGIQKWGAPSGGVAAVPRTSPKVGIPGSVGTNGKPMYGPAW
jgi:hypothetical protein